MLPITRVLNLEDEICIYRLFQIYPFSFEKYISGNMIAKVLQQTRKKFLLPFRNIMLFAIEERNIVILSIYTFLN